MWYPKIPPHLVADPAVDHVAFRLAVAVARFTNGDGQGVCTASNTTLAEASGLHVDQVRQKLRAYTGKLWAVEVSADNTRHHIRLLDTYPWKQEEGDSVPMPQPKGGTERTGGRSVPGDGESPPGGTENPQSGDGESPGVGMERPINQPSYQPSFSPDTSIAKSPPVAPELTLEPDPPTPAPKVRKPRTPKPAPDLAACQPVIDLWRTICEPFGCPVAMPGKWKPRSLQAVERAAANLPETEALFRRVERSPWLHDTQKPDLIWVLVEGRERIDRGKYDPRNGGQQPLLRPMIEADRGGEEYGYGARAKREASHG